MIMTIFCDSYFKIPSSVMLFKEAVMHVDGNLPEQRHLKRKLLYMVVYAH